MMGRGIANPDLFDNRLATPEMIAQMFTAGKPMDAIRQANGRLQQVPRSLEEEEDLWAFRDEVEQATIHSMQMMGASEAQIEQVVSAIVPPGRYNPTMDNARRDQAAAQRTNSFANLERARNAGGSGSGSQNNPTSLWVNSLAAKIIQFQREAESGQYGPGTEFVSHNVPGGNVRIFTNGMGILFLDKKLSKEERESLAESYGQDAVEKLESENGLGFDLNDLGPIIDILTPNTTIKKDLQNNFYPRITNSEGRVDPNSILNALQNTGGQKTAGALDSIFE